MNDRVPITIKAFEDIIARIAQFDSFTIGGRLYTADYLIPLLSINTKDLLEEAATTPALVMYWGREAARARRLVAETELQYRVWRERAYLEAKATPIVVGKDDKTGEPKTKLPTDSQAEAVVRIMPEYSEWYRRKISAQESAENAEAVQDAFKTKRDLIKSETEMLRNEAAGSSYVVVEDEPRETPRQPQIANQ